ncbi:MAG: metallophosphoesterase [Thermoleophilia bacterium]
MAAAALACAAGAPAADAAPVRFAVKGDWGDATPAQAAVTRRMCAEARRSPYAFVLTTGDNFSPAGEATAANFDRPERCLLRIGVRWRAAWGNHDVLGTGTATALDSPRRFYAFSAGPLRVVVLDGNDPDDPAQLRFLRAEMTRPRTGPRVVAFHQPIRTSGIHPPEDDARRLWEPLLRRGRVSLVLQGHNHMYERIEAGGITYITTAGGGAQVYPCVRLFTDGLRECAIEHHFLIVTATARALGVRVVSPRGRTIERVRIAVPRA